MTKIDYNVPQWTISKLLKMSFHSNQQITQVRGKERIDRNPREDSRLLRCYHQLCNTSQILISKMETNIELHDIRRRRQCENTSTMSDTYI